jgi:hypothetical protein
VPELTVGGERIAQEDVTYAHERFSWDAATRETIAAYGSACDAT